MLGPEVTRLPSARVGYKTSTRVLSSTILPDEKSRLASAAKMLSPVRPFKLRPEGRGEQKFSARTWGASIVGNPVSGIVEGKICDCFNIVIQSVLIAAGTIKVQDPCRHCDRGSQPSMHPG